MNEPPNLWPPRRRRYRSALLVIAGSILLVALTVLAWSSWEGERIAKSLSSGKKAPIVKKARGELGRRDPFLDIGRLQQSTVFLLIGSDKRWDEEGRGNSDTMMLVRVDPERNSASILSIPRDVLVDIPSHGQGKINSAYAIGGPALLIKTIRLWLNVPVDHFVETSFHGFATTINAVGGAYLPIDGRYLHKNDGTAINNWAEIDLHAGYQKLSGQQALSFVRFRHLDTDTTRAARQQLFLREIIRQMRAQSNNYLNLPKILKSIAAASSSDLDSLTSLMEIANSVRQIPARSITRSTIGYQDKIIDGTYYGIVSERDKREALLSWSGTPAVTTMGTPVVEKQSMDGTKTADKSYHKPVLVNNPLRAKTGFCQPKKLPPSYQWGDQEPWRLYKLAGHQSASAWATRGSGDSISWTWTLWNNPPILENPDLIVNNRLQLYRDGPNWRMVAWKIPGGWAWISNTLTSQLQKNDLLALAKSCYLRKAPPAIPPLVILSKKDRRTAE